MSPQTRTELEDLLDRHGLRPDKALGQHYLADPNLVRKIVNTAGVGPGDQVVEVGVGTGTLTRALAATGARVLAFEVDPRLRPVIAEVVGGLGNVEVRFADALLVEWLETLGGGPWVLVANLPYNVGTRLLLTFLRHVPAVERCVVMMQTEVADRVAAPPGSPGYGLPSVVAQLYARVEVAFRVPPQVFVPPPRVGSTVLTLARLSGPRPQQDLGRACELAAAAFGQRRKMLRRSLRSVVADPPALLAAAAITETRRAEDLSPAEYLRLAEVERG